jgi:hypothetical protein
MQSQDLKANLKAQPFRPFTIRMADGRTFDVKHPDFLLLSPNGRTAFVFQQSSPDYSIIDVMLMTEIQFQQLINQ